MSKLLIRIFTEFLKNFENFFTKKNPNFRQDYSFISLKKSDKLIFLASHILKSVSTGIL
ncbi:hypothetical protein EMIT036CA2_11252 [Chryseobacterium sp. IT-36CA2]